MNKEIKNKMAVFTEITAELNNLSSTPILYGSLGLAIAIQKDIVVKDIDILVEASLFKTSLQKGDR